MLSPLCCVVKSDRAHLSGQVRRGDGGVHAQAAAGSRPSTPRAVAFGVPGVEVVVKGSGFRGSRV